MTDHRSTDRTPEEMQRRLDDLQDRIDEDRSDLREDLGLTERRFIDPGTREPVDDTIVPPG